MNTKICLPLILSYVSATAFAALAIPVLYDASNNLHRDLRYHPEQPARIQNCVDAIRTYMGSTGDIPPIALMDVSDSSENRFTEEELAHARACLVLAHSEDLVSGIEQRCMNSRQKRINDGKEPLGFIGNVDDDTYLTTETYNVCLRATAAWIRCVDLAMSTRGSAMALTRPPGHHATSTLINGFCIFNFAAAAVIHALQGGSDIKVSVLDWDVHYGQGVVDILKKYDRARYVSIHQTPAFPFMGEYRKVDGAFKNILSIPIPPETTWTCGYSKMFREHALPFVRLTSGDDPWEPDLVIVCSGYDALDSDELASVSLQAIDYGLLTSELLSHLSVGINKRPALMLGLEGGYQLSPMAVGGNLGDAVVETIKALVREEAGKAMHSRKNEN